MHLIGQLTIVLGKGGGYLTAASMINTRIIKGSHFIQKA